MPTDGTFDDMRGCDIIGLYADHKGNISQKITERVLISGKKLKQTLKAATIMHPSSLGHFGKM